MFGPILTGENIALEPPRLEDLPVFRSWFSDLEVTRYILHRFVPSERQEEEWYDAVSRSETQVAWRIAVDGRPIGVTSLVMIDWQNRRAQSGTIIGDKTQWGKGYATEAVRLRTAYAFEELGMERLETETFANNLPMQRALERSGYQKIGRRRHHFFRQGGFQDALLFELLRGEWIARQGGEGS
jgi:ribosomal-protein-alanine N-acetyltransferase